MTRSPPSSHDTKDAWHWLGLAISLSYSIGLNRKILDTQPNLRRRKTERRVWWTTFIRDRSFALDAGAGAGWARPMRIKRDDCDVEILSLEDFEPGVGVETDEGTKVGVKSSENCATGRTKLSAERSYFTALLH